MPILHLHDESATLALGARIGAALAPGDVVALDGDLGAGKTVLARGIARGLGIRGRVASPTFGLLHLHETGRLPLAHMDLYRLGSAAELDDLGLDDLIAEGAAAVVEWAGRFPDALPADRLEIRLEAPTPAVRVATVTATGPRHQRLVDGLDG